LRDWVTEKACAKINLALHVLGRRDDGYHELDSVVAFADFGDALKIRIATENSFEVVGPFASNVPMGAENIISKAQIVLGEILARSLPPVEIILEKNLPVSSGIGGGSADAAAYLRAMTRLLQVDLTAVQIKTLAKNLGADVPVCFTQRTCRMQGIGELISPLMIGLPRASVLINPLKPCSTQAVFKVLNLEKGQTLGEPIDLENSPAWRNDLTQSALSVEPTIAAVLQSLKNETSFSASRMSGSGATCFGLAANMATASAAAARLSVRNPGWWVRAAEIV
jgi:4-diphosphocytidyl-2-C-methyl-D-erythritol kinase